MSIKKTDDDLRCSFCNKKQSQVKKLIQGPNGVFICDECVDICGEILTEELGVYKEADSQTIQDPGINLLKPQEIKDYLVKESENARLKRRTVNMLDIGADMDGDGMPDGN